jgi:ubiquinone/menaquinone biosynthesis C-methylase UbiE
MSLRSVYAEKALSQIPRLLSLQDRNPFSPTYGCFDRQYWLDKTVDFPNALPQFGVLSLALAYSEEMPGNLFYRESKVREWILAGMRFWTTLQHRDGSFDEFYPNEHGWAGPTGFLLYGMLKSYLLLHARGEFPADLEDSFLRCCRRAAEKLSRSDEEGVLANHHAVALLAVAYAGEVLRDPALQRGYERKLQEFLHTHTREGWSLEYDGADIGYLSATVSFLGKAWKLNHDGRLRRVMEESIKFLSYFVSLDGSFGGSLGSRNTLHFYPHGCEILAPDLPLAGRIADAMLESLRGGKLVPAEIMADRYFLYRIPEHLESFIDYGGRQGSALLPYEQQDFRRVFLGGRFYVEKRGRIYLLANAAKGGVTKVFRTDTGVLLLCDSGVIVRTTGGETLTSQWIDPDSTFTPKAHGYSVSGALHRVPAHRLFTPWKFLLFRLFLLLFGWHTGMAYRIKGIIRRLLMLQSGRAPVLFYRDVLLGEDRLRIRDKLVFVGHRDFQTVQLGDEFFVRYVPQSRYFQRYELTTQGWFLTEEQLQRLKRERRICVERTLDFQAESVSPPATIEHLRGTMGVEYREGRRHRRALTYRLRRRADELIGAIQRYRAFAPRDLLDLGAAEGKVLSRIQDAFPQIRCVGLEYSEELLDACTDPRLTMVQGDALDLPFPSASFDIVTASALIEHVADPPRLLQEIHRVLRPGGVVLLTTPVPFFERIAVALGHLPSEDHQVTMNLRELRRALSSAGFSVLELTKFMCSPWGCPQEQLIERGLRALGLQFLLLNQLAVGEKPVGGEVGGASQVPVRRSHSLRHSGAASRRRDPVSSVQVP